MQRCTVLIHSVFSTVGFCAVPLPDQKHSLGQTELKPWFPLPTEHGKNKQNTENINFPLPPQLIKYLMLQEPRYQFHLALKQNLDVFARVVHIRIYTMNTIAIYTIIFTVFVLSCNYQRSLTNLWCFTSTGVYITFYISLVQMSMLIATVSLSSGT